MKLKKLHITIIIILIWSFSFAQQYTNYSTKDGLPSNHVYTIVQDAQGFMWFLTDKGMVKYNGKTFKTFTTKEGLPNNDVWDAYTTPDGKIWYLSKSTHLGYIKNDSVYSFPNKTKNEIIYPNITIQIKDSVYASNYNKTYRLKDSTWQRVKRPNNRESVDNRKYYDKVFHKKVAYLKNDPRDKTISIYNKNNVLLKQYPTTNNIIVDGKARGQVTDSLYFWLSNTKYSILNLNTLKLKHFSFKEELGIETIKHSRINLVDNQLQITGTDFVGILNANFHITNPFYFPKQLNAHFGFIDRQNTIWLSTFNNGLYKLPAIKQSITYNFEDEKIQNINHINNQLLISVYNKGFYTYNIANKTVTPYLEDQNFIYGAHYIKALNTNIFLKKDDILAEENGKRIPLIFYGFKDNPSYYLDYGFKKITYFNKKIYAIGSGDILKINYSKKYIEKTIPQNGASDFLAFNMRFIVATTNGLKEIIKDSIYSIKFKEKAFTKSVLSIKAISKTQLLVNTDGFGSYITDLKTIKPLKGSEFLIVQDAFVKDKFIWLATNTGVLHFNNNNTNYSLIRKYNKNDGLPNNNVTSLFATDKDLIIGTNNGLATLPIHQKKQNSLMNLYIDNASYNGQLITNIQNKFNYKTNNTLKIEANTIDYSDNKSYNFSYKLEPIQNEWTTSTTNIINITNLQPDSYVFKIKSGNFKKQINFTIQPLWWQLLWVKILFYILTFALGLGIFGWFTYKRQDKKNKKLLQDKKLTEIQLRALRSQMNPHFVFNSLAAIQYYINKNDIETSEEYLVKFSRLIRQFFELSKQQEIDLAQEINLLESYLEIEVLRFKEKLSFSINFDTNLLLDQTSIPTMLLQPIVENAVNHGVFNKIENGLVKINFISINSETYKVEIIDDGVGFINTKNNANNINSSSVLKDRIHFLNQTKKWKINFKKEELSPTLANRGNKTTFIIKKEN